MYQTPDYDQIIAAYLQDVRNLRPGAAIDGDSDAYVRAAAVAGAVEGLYHHQMWIVRQVLPHTADPEYLSYHAALRGLTRKAPTHAVGILRVRGTPGTAIPAKMTARCGDLAVVCAGTEQTTDAAGTADVSVRALKTGRVDPQEDAEARLDPPPPGLVPVARLSIKGGSDVETDAELLERLLFYLRRPPSGGNRDDYERWCLEVPEITRAICHPLRRGPGTVDIVVVAGRTAPDDRLLQQVRQHLATRHCVTADVQVLPPCPVAMPVVAAITVIGTVAAYQARVEQALRDVVDPLLPGEPVTISKLAAAVSGLDGVRDVAIRSPAANLDISYIQKTTLGPVTLKALA